MALEASGLALSHSATSTIGVLIAAVSTAVLGGQQDGSWTRLKACDRDSCHSAYFDRSRNRSRRWCSMEGCGNVLKMRRRATSCTDA